MGECRFGGVDCLGQATTQNQHGTAMCSPCLARSQTKPDVALQGGMSGRFNSGGMRQGRVGSQVAGRLAEQNRRSAGGDRVGETPHQEKPAKLKRASNDRAFHTGWSVMKSKSRNQWCGVCNQKTEWVEQDPGEPETEYQCSKCGISDSTHTGMHRFNMAGGR